VSDNLKYKIDLKHKIDVMQACLDGEDIHCKYKLGTTYHHIKDPEFDWIGVSYRVKPNKEYTEITCREATEKLLKDGDFKCQLKNSGVIGDKWRESVLIGAIPSLEVLISRCGAHYDQCRIGKEDN